MPIPRHLVLLSACVVVGSGCAERSTLAPDSEPRHQSVTSADASDLDDVLTRVTPALAGLPASDALERQLEQLRSAVLAADAARARALTVAAMATLDRLDHQANVTFGAELGVIRLVLESR